MLAVSGRGLGQESPAALRGSVVTVGGDPVPYAIVQLSPGTGYRFTDRRGVFAFTPLPAGVYRFRARQVGFLPFVTVLAVGAVPEMVRIVLRPIAIELDAVTVTAAGSCSRPGPPDSARAPALAALYAQVRGNAERFAALTELFPFRYRMARAFFALNAARDTIWSARDTVEYLSDGSVRYRPGDVLRWGPGPAGQLTRVVNLPTLLDIADSTFAASHCFHFDGMVDVDGRQVVRMEYRAAESQAFSDIEGEVDLDPRTFQIRRATARLTRPGRGVPGLDAASTTLWFRELFPNIVIPVRVEGLQVTVLQRRMTARVARYTDEQRLIAVRFLRALPDSTALSPP